MPANSNVESVAVAGIGRLPLAATGTTFTPSSKSREHRPGRLTADGGYSVASTPARLEASLNNIAGVDVAALGDIQDADVTVRLSTGEVYLMSGASAEGAPTISDGESTLALFANESEKISG